MSTHYIAGQWLAGQGETLESLDPEEVCTRVHRAFTLRLPDAFCRISESRGNSRVGAITSCRMAAM
ncbi:hypothetical protein KZ850_15175, partial [Pseudomonas aeruginosa]|nr:hypothetical protein [Pseudomonas aeruginosa]